MRHKKKGRKFNMPWEHRKSMFNNMARSMITHGRIKTTVAKAKELRGLVEGLVTLAIRNDLHARRQAFKVLNSHKLVQKLFDEIGPRYAGSPTGGYTRVVKLALPRPGDCAPLAIIELIQPGEAAPATKPKKAKKAATSEPAPVAETPEAAPEAVEEPAADEAPQEAVTEAPVEEAAPEAPAETSAEEAEPESEPESEADDSAKGQ